MDTLVIEGTVVHGRQLGRKLGFPTANLAVPDTLEAADGVYLSEAEVGGIRYAAMWMRGRNPSVGGRERRRGGFRFGLEGGVDGRTLRIRLLARLREERKFASVEELQHQIETDSRAAEAFFAARESAQ